MLFKIRCCFFSSRRRHTRLVSDWSSDVCSSDLVLAELAGAVNNEPLDGDQMAHKFAGGPATFSRAGFPLIRGQIGRASCRERGYIADDAGSLKYRTPREYVCPST